MVTNVLHQAIEPMHEKTDLEAQVSEVGQLSLSSPSESTRRWSVTTVISWDTLPGSAEHQEARKISSKIKTTPGSKETKKTLPRKCWIDGCGFDWTKMAEKIQVQSNMALMIYQTQKLHDKSCSNTVLIPMKLLEKFDE
ncbi:hypothetical protein Tco_0223295 [Tanacetum coccineum]